MKKIDTNSCILYDFPCREYYKTQNYSDRKISDKKKSKA